jgi:hypothetical protein
MIFLEILIGYYYNRSILLDSIHITDIFLLSLADLRIGIVGGFVSRTIHFLTKTFIMIEEALSVKSSVFKYGLLTLVSYNRCRNRPSSLR